MSKKIMLKLGLHCEKCKRRAMKTVAGIEGVESIKINAENNTISVTGDADPVRVTASLRKYGFTELVSVKQCNERCNEPEKYLCQEILYPENEPEKYLCQEILYPENLSYTIPTRSYYQDSSYTHYWSDESPSTCTIS